MRIRNRWTHSRRSARPTEMTSMIDIVFLLLIFFVMTFRVVADEGDLGMAVPAGQRQLRLLQAPPRLVAIRLEAGDDGHLRRILLDGRLIEPSANASATVQLHKYIRALVADHDGTGVRLVAEIRSDSTLRYHYALDAITAVSGYRAGRGPDAEIVPLIEKVRFLRTAGSQDPGS